MQTKKIGSILLVAFLVFLPLAQAAEESQHYLEDVKDLVGTAGVESVVLNWSAVPSADSYTIYYGTESVSVDGGDYQEQILVRDKTRAEIKDLIAEQEYFFAVAAENSSKSFLGSYNYSNEIRVVPLVKIEPIKNINEPKAENETGPESTAEPAAKQDPDSLKESAPSTPATENPFAKAFPEKLPQSGPGLTLLLAATAAAYFWRRKKI